MPYSFKIGDTYTRKDVYRTIGLLENTRGGNYDTEYWDYNGANTARLRKNEG